MNQNFHFPFVLQNIAPCSDLIWDPDQAVILIFLSWPKPLSQMKKVSQLTTRRPPWVVVSPWDGVRDWTLKFKFPPKTIPEGLPAGLKGAAGDGSYLVHQTDPDGFRVIGWSRWIVGWIVEKESAMAGWAALVRVEERRKHGSDQRHNASHRSVTEQKKTFMFKNKC